MPTLVVYRMLPRFWQTMPMELVCSAVKFLYLQSETFPTEEEQFRAYKTVVETMAGKKYRKNIGYWGGQTGGYFGLDKEDNPALGYSRDPYLLKAARIFSAHNFVPFTVRATMVHYRLCFR